MSDIPGTIITNRRLHGSMQSSKTLSGNISDGRRLSGSIGTSKELNGSVEKVLYLSGSINGQSNIKGTLENAGSLKGTVAAAISHGEIEIYDGSYIATPSMDAQIFPTKFKKMIDDFKVNATPMSDVRTVDTDGYTITVL